MSDITTERPVERVLTERIRPKKVERVCMIERVRKVVSGLVDKTDGHLLTNVLFYSKTPGTGKTTLTRILSDGCVKLELNASKDRGIDVIRNEVTPFLSSKAMNIGSTARKVVVLEEMDGMTDQAFDALRALIENSGDVRFIGNCNDINKIPAPIQSRFTCIALEPTDTIERDELVGQYVMYVSALLKKFNVAYTQESVTRFVENRFPSMRDIVNDVDVIVHSGITDISEYTPKREYQCEELFEFIFKEDEGNDAQHKVEIYEMVVTKYGSQSEDVIRGFCDQFIDYVLDKHKEYMSCVDLFAITLADYMDQLTRTTNPKIVLMALVFGIYQIIHQN